MPISDPATTGEYAEYTHAAVPPATTAIGRMTCAATNSVPIAPMTAAMPRTRSLVGLAPKRATPTVPQTMLVTKATIAIIAARPRHSSQRR